MNRFFALAVAVSSLGFLVSCSKPPTPLGTGVIDLDRVAAALSWNKLLENALQRKDSELSAQIEVARDNMQNQLQAKSAEAGNGSDVEKAELQQMNANANRILQNLVANAQQQTNQYRMALINDFRTKVEPYAKQAAAEKGLAVVFLKAEPVYYAAPPADISERVITLMQTAGNETTGVDTLPDPSAPEPTSPAPVPTPKAPVAP